MSNLVSNQFAQGGISPAQMALTTFTLGENILGNAGAFNMGPSTMETMLDAGARNRQAQQAQQLSQQDAQALMANQQNQKAGLSSGIGTLGSLLGGGV